MDFKEKEIKKTLEARKIKPSKEVWEKLDKQLSQNKRKTPLYFYWSGIAATLLIIILFGNFYNSENNESEVNVSVEESSSLKEKENTTDNLKESHQGFKGWVETSNKKSEETEKNPSEEIHSTSPQFKNSGEKKLAEAEKGTAPDKEESIAKSSRKDKNVVLENEENSISKKEELIDLEIIDSKYSSTDEVERLLTDAFTTITAQEEHLAEQNIDASNLLKEVNEEIENEANWNLREHMEQLMKDGWFKAKTAFAANK
ncbi:MAG TPA: hypothetical protein VK021_02510 [Flavobacteriaceae bacterium]|nr:hypothetical protein [Flavobacteriaceae bacterium]